MDNHLHLRYKPELQQCHKRHLVHFVALIHSRFYCNLNYTHSMNLHNQYLEDTPRPLVRKWLQWDKQHHFQLVQLIHSMSFHQQFHID